MPKKKEETNQPVDRVRLGAITAAIWKNDTENGSRYNVTFQRVFKQGDGWGNSDSFSRDDLLKLAKVAELACIRIHELQADEK